MADGRKNNKGAIKDANEKKIPITIYKKKSDVDLLGIKDVREFLRGQFDNAIKNRKNCLNKNKS